MRSIGVIVCAIANVCVTVCGVTDIFLFGYQVMSSSIFFNSPSFGDRIFRAINSPFKSESDIGRTCLAGKEVEM